jgi:hypothetical protein
MATEGVDFELRVKIEKLKEELEKIPGMSKKTAEGMARAYSSEYKKMAREAEKAARVQGEHLGKVGDKAKDTAERVASLFGGAFADVSDSVLDLGGRFAELSTTVGGAGGVILGAAGGIAAVSLAAGFAAQQMMEFMSTSREAREALSQFAGLEPVSAADIRALEDYERAADAMEGVFARMTVQLQAELAPAMTKFTSAITGAADVMADLGGQETAAETVTGLGRAVIDSLPVFSELAIVYDTLARSGENAAEGIKKLTAAQIENARGSDFIYQTNEDLEAMAALLGDGLVPLYRDLDKEREQREKAIKAAHDAAKTAEADHHKVVVDMWNEAMKAGEARVKAEEDFAKATKKNMPVFDKMIEDLKNGYKGVAEAADEFNQHVVDSQRQALTTLTNEALDTALQATDARIDALKREADYIDAQHGKAIRRLDTTRDQIDADLAAGKVTEAEAKRAKAMLADQIREEKKAAREQKKELKKKMMDAYAAQKAFAVGKALADAGAASIALLASPGIAFLGPFAPAAVAAIVGTQLGLSLSAINTQPPPTFAQGGMVRDRAEGGHVTISAEPDEGILTPRGVAAVGGPQGLAAANRGQGMGGGGGVTQVFLDRRMLGEVVAQTILTDRRVSAALDARTRALPGIRR